MLKQEIARLDQQIAMLKAQQEQAAEAELIQQQAARYKNNLSKPKPAWVWTLPVAPTWFASQIKQVEAPPEGVQALLSHFPRRVRDLSGCSG